MQPATTHPPASTGYAATQSLEKRSVTASHSFLCELSFPSKESGAVRCLSCGKPHGEIRYAAHPAYCDLICWKTRTETLDKTIARRWPKALKPGFQETYGAREEVQLHQRLNPAPSKHKISNLCRTKLGLKLELRRLETNLTLLDWQRQCGINQEPYQKILQGERNLTDETLGKALDACGIEDAEERQEMLAAYKTGRGKL